MKKNDIISQKLFETCKLSEFYLNLLKHEDESPMQLAHAYKQKLYEIVERYDRLLEANKHREELNLELKQANNLSISNKTSTPHKSASALSTPLSGHMPISILTSSSSTNLPPNSSTCSSYASTPATTPGHSSSAKSTFGTYARGSTRSIYSQANQQHHYSNKQMQKFDYLYADTTDEEGSEDEEFYDYNISKANNLKCQLEYDTYSSTRNKAKGLINSESDEEEEKCGELDGDNMLSLQYTKNIEKSYSNLSKDSGVFGESYHSECSSSHKQSRTISGHDNNESAEDRISDEDNTFEENLTSPTSSSSSSNNYSRDETNFHSAESTPKSSIKKANNVEHSPSNDSFIWGTVSRLVEEEPSSKTPPSFADNSCTSIESVKSDQLPTRSFKPVKPKFFVNKLAGEQPKQNLLKSSLNNSLLKQTNNYRIFSKNVNNLNVDIDNTHMMSMMAEQSSEVEFSPSPDKNSLPEITDEERDKTSPFIFNYNSLMNVSMLDNIQATNTVISEIDNMTSSILMFN